MIKRKEYEGKMKSKAEQAKASKALVKSIMNPDAKPFVPSALHGDQRLWGSKPYVEETKSEEEVARRRRKHRNINRNNGPRGALPDIVQLIEDLKLDQSQLLSIRISLCRDWE